MADLLNIWSIFEASAKYCNPYASDGEKQVATFKALADTWITPEVHEWHKHTGDFCGPILRHLRRINSWMTVAEAFNTGVDHHCNPIQHGFCIKENDEIVESWRRPECTGMKDSPNGICSKPCSKKSSQRTHMQTTRSMRVFGGI
jgi:hypothetical protein